MPHPLTDTPEAGFSVLAGLVSRRLSPREISDARWPTVIGLAIEHGLGPVLWWTIANSGIDPGSDSIWTPLIQSAREATTHSLLLDNARRQLGDALAEADIPALWLKGAALAHTVYPWPALRPMIDLDLLVPFEQRLPALAAIEALGFHPWGAFAFDAAPGLLHHFAYHYSLRGGTCDVVAVELHFHLLDKIRAKPLLSPEQLRWFWAQAWPVADDNLPFLVLRPEAHLLYLCAHAILQHGEADLRLLRYLDLHQLITHHEVGESLDWRLVVDRAVILGWTDAVARALSRTAAFFGTTVPPWVWLELRERRPPTEEVYSVVERQATANRWEELRTPLAGLNVKDRLRVLRVIALPSATHLRHRYSVAANLPIWPGYPRLWLGQGREIVDWLRHSRRTVARGSSVAPGRGDPPTS